MNASAPNPVELDLTDDELANFPSYSWPLRCCWCGSGMGARVKAADVDGMRFVCDVCGKPNVVRRAGNRVTISPPQGSPLGCLFLIGIIGMAVFLLGQSGRLGLQLPSIAMPVADRFSARLLRWMGYAAGVAFLVNLPFHLTRWKAVRTLYGRIPWSFVWQMWRYSGKNKLLRIQLWLLYVVFAMGPIPIITYLVGADLFGVMPPLSEGARSLRLPVLLLFVWQADRCFSYLLPPAGLLLGTAKSVNVHLVAVLHRMLRPYRVVSLLDLGKEHIFPPYVPAVMYNNLRTVNGHEWRTIVHHLMDVVPVLIVDEAASTVYFDEEIRRIERFGYQHRVVSFSTSDIGDDINALGAGIGSVIKAADRLGEEVAPRVLERLKRPVDIASRWAAQNDYTEMVQAVPKAVRFNSEINAMLLKAHYILAWTMQRYIRETKQSDPESCSGCLLEDVPSRLTPAEEKAYLRGARGLDEVRGIAKGALDLARETPGDNQAYNVANAHTKLGKCARFAQDYEAALDHLAQSIESLRGLASGALGASNVLDVKRELADAYFIRGDVHMARFRENNLETSKERALSDFRNSMDLDRELQQDSSETASRIRNLSS